VKILKLDRLYIAILLSIVIHGVLIAGLIAVWPESSAKGDGTVMMLEAIDDQTQVQQSAQAATASQAQSNLESQEPSKQSPFGKKAQTQTTQSSQQPERTASQASTSNTGLLEDQSGQAPTPSSHYQQALLKHLLNKMDSAPVTGKANVHLTVMSAGIATQVNIEVTAGGMTYKNWLQSKVLNANPFPPIPASVTQRPFKTTLPIEHQLEK